MFRISDLAECFIHVVSYQWASKVSIHASLTVPASIPHCTVVTCWQAICIQKASAAEAVGHMPVLPSQSSVRLLQLH